MINPEDINPDLEDRHKGAMLDLILAWAEIDGALSMFVYQLADIPHLEGAKILGRQNASTKLQAVKKIFEEHDSENAKQAISMIKKYKKKYTQFSKPRDRIAHSKCQGYWINDPDYIVFWVFEKHGDGELAVEAIPIQQMEQATLFGKQFTKSLLGTIDKLEKIRERHRKSKVDC